MKTMATWNSRSKFNYSGSVSTDTIINYGKSSTIKVTANQYVAMLKEFNGKTVPCGCSHTTPHEKSLGAWLIKNVCQTGIASYVGSILVDEGYAVKEEGGDIRFHVQEHKQVTTRSRERRYLTVAVGYAWDKEDESRWDMIRGFLSEIQGEVRRRYANILKRSVPIDCDEEKQGKASSTKNGKSIDPLKGLPEQYYYVSKVVRLRATAGRHIGDAIHKRINEADLLVFDLTPPKSRCQECVPGNVLLELGATLGDKEHPPVYPIVDCYEKRKKTIPSDLQGLLIGEIPGDPNDRFAKASRMSLRMAILNDLLRRLESMDKAMTVTNNNP